MELAMFSIIVAVILGLVAYKILAKLFKLLTIVFAIKYLKNRDLS